LLSISHKQLFAQTLLQLFIDNESEFECEEMEMLVAASVANRRKIEARNRHRSKILMMCRFTSQHRTY